MIKTFDEFTSNDQRSTEDIAYIWMAGNSMSMGQRSKEVKELNAQEKHITDVYDNLVEKYGDVFTRMCFAINKLGEDQAFKFIMKGQHSGWKDYVYTGKEFKRMNEDWLHDRRLMRMHNLPNDASLGNPYEKEDEEFEDALCDVIEYYKDSYIGKGYSPKDFSKWCMEIINKYLEIK